MKQSVIEHKIDENDKFPCSATAAIACSNYYSALEILEKHVVKKDLSGITIFDRELFSLLQVWWLLKKLLSTFLASLLQRQRCREHSRRVFAYYQQFCSVGE